MKAPLVRGGLRSGIEESPGWLLAMVEMAEGAFYGATTTPAVAERTEARRGVSAEVG